MRNLSTVVILRLIACTIWFTIGLFQGGTLGYASSVASALFIVAIRLELAGYED